MNPHQQDPSSEHIRTLAPSVQFPITICVLCYGPHADLARRFLESLCANTAPGLFSLRAGLNEVEPTTRRLFQEYSAKLKNIDLYLEPKNVFKNPLMRRMFHEKPITSKWTVWCDDDTHFARPDWLQRLALKIETSPKVAMWGSIHQLWLQDEPTLDWIRRAVWYRNVQFHQGKDLDGNDASEFRFATGAFWAIRTTVLYKLNWPDSRLKQGAEDFVLGEALRQNGFAIENFRYGIRINDAARRNSTAPEHTHILQDE